MTSVAPPKPPRSRLDAQVVARVHADDLDRLRELATSHGRSVGRELRVAISDHLRRQRGEQS